MRYLIALFLCCSTLMAKPPIGYNDPTIGGLVGWWTMNEGTGTVTTADLSGNGNTGYLTNSPAWTNGVVRSGLAFFGTNAIATSQNVNFTTNKMSFLAWLYITATNPVQVICEQTLNYNSGNAFIIVYNDESPYKIDFRDCLSASISYNIRATINSPVTNKWFHLACVIDRSLGLNEMSIYFNGISQPLQSIGGFDASNTNLNFQSAKCYFA